MPKSKNAIALATTILSLAVEAFRAAGDLTTAKKVEDILHGRPDLQEEEADMHRRALERLGR